MTIRDYIRDEVFGRRAHEAGCLVVYDPARRYRDVVAGMASDRCRVIDTLNSVVEQREAATEAYGLLAAGKIGQLIIWVPASRPIDAEARPRDPFSVFGLITSQRSTACLNKGPQISRSSTPWIRAARGQR